MAMPENQIQALPIAEEREPITGRAPARSVRLPGSTVFQENAAEQVFNLFSSYAPLAYMLSWEVLDYVEILAKWNPDYSQAVQNIKTLSNSGHNLFVDHSSANKGEKIKARLEEKARTIQERHGGIDGLIGKLLEQAATYGAMCGEWVPNEELDDIVEFIDVNPKTIRFFWEDSHWAHYQKVTRAQAEEAKKNGQKVRNGDCVKLNENTFHYYAFDAAPGSPYGVPPYIAALRNIGIQSDMINNMAKIVKKIGLLGVMHMAVEPLSKNRGETDAEFATRARAFLSEYAASLEDALEGGGMVHFNDAELKLENVGGNAAGATNIFKQNEELIFSGLKSMPSVQGRSYSTTETYAGVAYDIIIRMTYTFQRAAKRMIESGYWLMATMWGETPKSIRLEFNSNKSLHRLQDAQSSILEIKFALMLWVTGVIDQIGFAQLLGYSSVKKEMLQPPDSQILGNGSPGGGAGANSTDPGNASTGPPARGDSSPDVSPDAMIEELNP